MTAAMRRTVLLRVAGILGGLVVGSAAMLQWDGVHLLPQGASVFLVGAVVGERLPIRQPYGATLPMSLAVVGAMALIGTPPHLLAAFAGATWIIAAASSSALGRGTQEWVGLPRRLLGGWTLSAVAILISTVPAPDWVIITPASLEPTPVPSGLNSLAAIAIGAVIIFGIPLTESVMRDARVNAAWSNPLWLD